jgi:AcrR family transcriptional regulator
MRDSPTKRIQVVHAAADLFGEHGYERTTLAMVARESGLSIGSIVNFYDDKATLAAAVYDYAAATLVAACDGALNGQGRDVAKSVRATIFAYADWAGRFPRNPYLMRILEPCLHWHADGQAKEVSARISKLLEDWAEPLIRTESIVRLMPLQLYSVMLAPVMFATSIANSDNPQNSIAWLEVLVEAALAAIVLKSKDHGGATKASRRTSSAPRPSPEPGGLI